MTVKMYEKKIQELCSGALRKAAVNGDIDDEGSVVVGQIAGSLNKKQDVKMIMEELIHDCRSILSHLPQYLLL
jgi:hypothetical protein